MFTEFAQYGVDPLTVSNFVDIIAYKEEFPVDGYSYTDRLLRDQSNQQ